jgi:Domain of unknown function (DUF4349)
MITKAFTALAATVLLLYACNHNTATDEKYSPLLKEALQSPGIADSIPVSQEDPIPTNKPEQEKTSEAATNKKPTAPASVSADWDKKIIKTADMNVEVKDCKTFASQTREISKKYGGYVAAEKQETSACKIENSVTLKVPVAMFDDMMNDLSQLPVKIISKQVGTQDVGTEMVDTRSRIEAKKQVRDKYVEFLKGSKNMEEVLRMQHEINGVQEQIETAAGRVNYLGQAAAYSTIHLTFYQVLDANAAVDAAPGFTDKLSRAMGYGLDVIKALVLGVVTIWPLLLIAAIVWLIYKRSKKQASAPKP